MTPSAGQARAPSSSARAGSDIDVRGTARSRVREADERAAIAAGALVFVTFPKVENGSGFPARVIAVVP